jgi:glycosyltransferase involved in cell wall biosynthesis
MARVVMFVLNDCRTDVRVLREAETLASAGHDVTVIARPSDPDAGVGDREERVRFTIVRVPITTGRFRRRALSFFRRAIPRRTPSFQGGSPIRRPPPGLGMREGFVELARWRWSYLSWARAAAAQAGAADVYHGHDLPGLAAAYRTYRRHGGHVVYDSHELFLETTGSTALPGWARRVVERLEGRWSRPADALVTVNQSIADVLGQRLRPKRTVVVMNCPPRWDPPAVRPDHLRHALGLAPGTALVLYHGGFLADRGLPQAIAAMAEPGLADAHLALLGWGEEETRLRTLATEPGVAGRVHVLAAVPPAELAGWVASADVGIMVNQPRTLNERLSTPNKLFECLAVGLPVVSSDFPERRRIIVDDPDGPLGAVCDPTDPTAIAHALRSILSLDPTAAADLRARCLRAAHERYAWEVQAPRLLAAYTAATGRPW